MTTPKPTLEHLKSIAYDLLASIEQEQTQLRQVSIMIKEFKEETPEEKPEEKPKETPVTTKKNDK